ncbi:MAG: glycerol-3-phosphate acyltransferase [Pseudobutyrivibrio sp.]|nr:glycerol-3-phosphate acyltransferase [Pseudobutyrivibrio sp.]
MILCGYILGRIKKVDLTKVGSGNVGTTNTLRNLGVSAGAITLLVDCLKCVFAVAVVWFVMGFRHEDPSIFMVYAGLGTVLGHDFPVYLRFKGGKGIASTLGFIIALFPFAVPIPAVIFISVVALTRYVSLGSILGILSFGIEITLFGMLGRLEYTGTQLYEVYAIVWFIVIVAISLHHANIKRLINGNENKFSFHPETRK